MRVSVAAATALSGLALAVGVQRKDNAEALDELTARDIYCTSRISPDGERINGSWVAAKLEDQELVDLAQSVHTTFLNSLELPPVARQILIRRCSDLERELGVKRGSGDQAQSVTIENLRSRLLAVRTALLDSDGASGFRRVPLTEQERTSLCDLIESVFHPLCLWRQDELKELFRGSDANLGKVRL